MRLFVPLLLARPLEVYPFGRRVREPLYRLSPERLQLRWRSGQECGEVTLEKGEACLREVGFFPRRPQTNALVEVWGRIIHLNP